MVIINNACTVLGNGGKLITNIITCAVVALFSYSNHAPPLVDRLGGGLLGGRMGSRRSRSVAGGSLRGLRVPGKRVFSRARQPAGTGLGRRREPRTPVRRLQRRARVGRGTDVRRPQRAGTSRNVGRRHSGYR